MQVLTLGETMVLVHPADAETLERATAFRLDIGGAESNVASHLVRLGVPSAWASAVGDDALGRRLLDTLRVRGVDTALVLRDDGAPTGVYFKAPGVGVLYYRSGSAASRLDAGFAAALPLDTVPWVHVSGITAMLSAGCRALLDAVFDAREHAELPVSFDVNHRPALRPAADAKDDLLALARRADLVFVGRDEAERLWGTSTADAVAALILHDARAGTRLVVKDAEIGAYLFTVGEGEWFAPAHEVDVVEPTGAGDAFAAGFLAGSLAGLDPVDALRAGHDSAARVLRSMSDFSPDEETAR